MSEELRECPFCGGEVHRIGGDNEDVSHNIECTKCAYIFYDLSTGNGWWNSRPLEDALLEENKRLRKTLEKIRDIGENSGNGYISANEEMCGYAQEALK